MGDNSSAGIFTDLNKLEAEAIKVCKLQNEITLTHDLLEKTSKPLTLKV